MGHLVSTEAARRNFLCVVGFARNCGGPQTKERMRKKRQPGVMTTEQPSQLMLLFFCHCHLNLDLHNKRLLGNSIPKISVSYSLAQVSYFSLSILFYLENLQMLL